MIKQILSVRGMKDYLQEDMALWNYVENILKNVLICYGYREILLPIVEKTSLFQRAIGKITDVVEKEMYSFFDRHNESLTLRPEGTAGCVRSGIENNIFYNKKTNKIWYSGPMFRYERPQKGRYRQFHQIGAEVFGQSGPDIDFELILITSRWWRILGLSKYMSLEINSIGSTDTYKNYCKELIKFFNFHKNHLDDDCKRKINTNPIRILDTKNPNIQILLNHAPKINNYLDKESKFHFLTLCKLLDYSNIKYVINQRLVRGLDYYNKTVFEWVSSNIGSQNSICGGGRYDGLIERLGGRPTPAAGFAIGLERLLLLIKTTNTFYFKTSFYIDVYLMISGNNLLSEAFILAEKIRDKIPYIKLIINHGNKSFKKQFFYANKIGAKIALILGENEIKYKTIIIKDLITRTQKTLFQKDIFMYLIKILNKKE